jgi:hypothetical protein
MAEPIPLDWLDSSLVGVDSSVDPQQNWLAEKSFFLN